MAREAGPKPMQRRSSVSLGEEEKGACPLRCMLSSCSFDGETPFEWKLESSSAGVLIADGAILMVRWLRVGEVT